MYEWNQRILKRLKRGQKCPHRLILSFLLQTAKEEPDMSELADAAICKDALEAFCLLRLKNRGVLTTDPVLQRFLSELPASCIDLSSLLLDFECSLH